MNEMPSEAMVNLNNEEEGSDNCFSDVNVASSCAEKRISLQENSSSSDEFQRICSSFDVWLAAFRSTRPQRDVIWRVGKFISLLFFFCFFFVFFFSRELSCFVVRCLCGMFTNDYLQKMCVANGRDHVVDHVVDCVVDDIDGRSTKELAINCACMG